MLAGKISRSKYFGTVKLPVPTSEYPSEGGYYWKKGSFGLRN
jgi:hypothetical protein